MENEKKQKSDTERVIEILKSDKEYASTEERCWETGLFVNDCNCRKCEHRQECSTAK